MGGCCSKSKPATQEEMQIICKAAAKEMMTIFCIDDALKDPSQILIQVPPVLEDIRKTRDDLRKTAEELNNKVSDDPAEDNAEPAEPPKEEAPTSGLGGFMAGAMGAISKVKEQVQDLAEQGLEKAVELGSKGSAAALTQLATTLDEAVAKVEEPMQSIAKDVVTAVKPDVEKYLKDFVKEANMGGAVALCQGGEETAISKALVNDQVDDLTAKLRPIVEAQIQKHAGLKAWDTAIDTYNKGIDGMKGILEKAKEFAASKQVELPEINTPSPIKLDIEEYICKSIVLELGRLMGEAETKHRAEPDVGGASDIFIKVFKKEELTHEDYKKAVAVPA